MRLKAVCGCVNGGGWLWSGGYGGVTVENKQRRTWHGQPGKREREREQMRYFFLCIQGWRWRWWRLEWGMIWENDVYFLGIFFSSWLLIKVDFCFDFAISIFWLLLFEGVVVMIGLGLKRKLCLDIKKILKRKKNDLYFYFM